MEESPPSRSEHRPCGAPGGVAARARARGRARRRGRRDARQERLDRLQPARQPRATRASPTRRPGGVYALAPEFREQVAAAVRAARSVGVVDDLLARTHKRAYLAVLRGRVTCAWWSSGACRACRSCPAWTRRSATTPTRSRSARSCSRSRPTEAVERYIAGRPARASRRAPSPSPTRCGPSCAGSGGPGSPPTRGVRRRTSAVSPPRSSTTRRRFLGAVGISMSRRAFDDERAALEETLRDVVQIPAICGKAATFLIPIPARP